MENTVHTDSAALQQFLSSNAKNPELIPEVMELVQPFFKIAETGDYPLSPSDELDGEEVAHAISEAIGEPVEKIVFVSRACPFPKPEWISQDVYLYCIRESLVGESLWSSLWDRLSDSLWNSLGDSLWASLGVSLWASLTVRLRYSLRVSLGVSLVDSLEDSLWVSLGDSLVYFLGFAIVGDTERVERLTPLITMLPKAIPISKKKDEPGTWLVLCA